MFEYKVKGLKNFFEEDRVKRLHDDYAWVQKPDNAYDQKLEEKSPS